MNIELYVVRWMVRADMPYTLAIERECYSDPWDEATFLNCLRQKNCVGMVVTVKNQIHGFMIYEIHKHHIQLVNMAIHPHWQRRTLGKMMMAKLKDNIESKSKRRMVQMVVSECCLGAHCFLRNQGFQAIRVERDFFKVGDSYEDAYHFCYDHGKPYHHECVKEEMLCQGK